MRSQGDTQTGIRRLDDDRNGTHGFLVRLQRQGQVFAKHFSDGVHGSGEQAYRAACAYRDTVIREHPPWTRADYARLLRKNNTSGIPGVCQSRQYWIAFWPTTPGKRKHVKFSITRFGAEQAFERAVAARQRALESLNEPFTRAVKNNPKRRRVVKPIAVPDPRIRRVAILRYRLRVELQDERVIAVPLSWFPALLKALPEDRQHWVLTEAGNGIVWEKLGLTITAAQLLKTA